MDELILIFKKMLHDESAISSSEYTFVTDGTLDKNCSNFVTLYKLVKQLKHSNQPTAAIIKEINSKEFYFNSKSTLFGKNGLKGDAAQLIKSLHSIFHISKKTALLEALSKLNVLANYSEDIIKASIINILEHYVPRERITSVIDQLISQLIHIAKNPPVRITRDELFNNIGIPSIPIISQIVENSCLKLIMKQIYSSSGLAADSRIRRPQLEKAFLDFFQDSTKNCFLLTGASGVGKTTSCQSLAVNYSKTVPTVYIDARQYTTKDPIQDISQKLSLELGRTDILHIETILSRLQKARPDSSTKLLILFDGIDSLPQKRFNEIESSLVETFFNNHIKVLYSCKSEHFTEYKHLFKFAHFESETAPTSFADFCLEEYSRIEFLDALRHHGFKVSKYDDIGNDALYTKNAQLHKPLYLSIFSKLLKTTESQFPPSIGISLVFENYLHSIVSSVANELTDLPSKLCERIVWNIIVVISNYSQRKMNPTISDLHHSIKDKYPESISIIYRIIAKLKNIGLICYEPNAKPQSSSVMPFLQEISSESAIRLFHEEIGEWILALENARMLLAKNDEELTTILRDAATKPEIMLAFGMIYHLNPSRYYKLLLRLLVQMPGSYETHKLMSALDTPSRDFLNTLLDELKQNCHKYAEVAHILYCLYFERGLESNAMSLYSEAINSYYAAQEIRSRKDVERMFQPKTKADILNNIGVSYLGLGQTENAIKTFEESARTYPNWHSYYNLALLEFNAENYSSCIAFIDKAISAESNLRKGLAIQSLNTKAACIFRTGKIEEACVMWQAILAESSDCMHSHFICIVISNLGDALFRLMKYAEAIKCFLKVITLDPETNFNITRSVIIYLIVSFLKNENPKEAKRYLHRYQNIMDEQIINYTLENYDLHEYKSYFM